MRYPSASEAAVRQNKSKPRQRLRYDLTGEIFGDKQGQHLKVIGEGGVTKDSKILWVCECHNPDVHEHPIRLKITTSNLRSRRVRSCGCLVVVAAKKTISKVNAAEENVWNSVDVEFRGESYSLHKWSEITKIPYSTLRWRMSNGEEFESVIREYLKEQENDQVIGVTLK